MKMTSKKHVEIYTDGSASPNDGTGDGGWGWVSYYRGKEKETGYGGCKKTTNNIMEMTAFLEALKHHPVGERYTIYSDSSYVLKTLVDGGNGRLDKTHPYSGWLVKWKATNFKNKKNVELWCEIDDELQRHVDGGSRFTLKWVKGHNNDVGNERADELANLGRKTFRLPVSMVKRQHPINVALIRVYGESGDGTKYYGLCNISKKEEKMLKELENCHAEDTCSKTCPQERIDAYYYISSAISEYDNDIDVYEPTSCPKMCMKAHEKWVEYKKPSIAELNEWMAENKVTSIYLINHCVI
jgi:ribonuclease HI